MSSAVELFQKRVPSSEEEVGRGERRGVSIKLEIQPSEIDPGKK